MTRALGPGALPLVGRLSVGAVGLSLVLAVSLAWLTAAGYLAARLGVDPRVRLASIDGAHIYVGLVGGVFVAAKAARVGFRYRVEGVPNVVRWHRWVSWSMLILCSVIFLSGLLALLPIRGGLYRDLVDVHLMMSIWAVVPTTWHVWHYRKRALPFLSRMLSDQGTQRFWAGVAIFTLPALILFVAFPRAASQLPQVMGGSAWTQAALQGSFLARVVSGPQPGSLIAAGDALYESEDGVVWTQLDLPPAATPSGGQASAVHVHNGNAPTGNTALSLAVVGNTIYVGTTGGLYTSRGMGAQLSPLALPGQEVGALAVDPASPLSIWAGSSAGLMYSADGGGTWSPRISGLSRPGAVSALAFMAGRLYASDSAGVFQWEPGSGSWRRVSDQPSVVSLVAAPDDRELYATSTSQGVEIMAGGRWLSTASLASPHQHHHAGNEVHPQVLGVTVVDGRLYAVGTAYGVSASADDGQTWTQLGAGLADVTPEQAVGYDGLLVAATSNGLYRFPLASAVAPPAAWWLSLVVAAVLCGLGTITIAAVEPRARRRKATSKSDHAA